MHTTDLFRQLAAAFGANDRFDAVVASADDAVRFFVRHVHGNGCPRCASRRWTPHGRHHVDCDGCGVVSVYRGTPLQRRRLRLQPLLAALHAIHVATSTPSARGFSRAWQLRLGTTWALLHELRDALPPPPLPTDCRVFPLLGNCGDDNDAAVALGVVDGAVTAVVAVVDEGCVEGAVVVEGVVVGPLPALLWAWWGLLRAWLTSTFRGVSRGHLDRYLREWCARHGRVLGVC